MKERGILMCGDMVRATLRGDKTQTRRVLQPQPVESACRKVGIIDPEFGEDPCDFITWLDRRSEGKGRGEFDYNSQTWRSKYGIAGDRLYVRENFWPTRFPGKPMVGIHYAAGGDALIKFEKGMRYAFPKGPDAPDPQWKEGFRYKNLVPSIFMPKFASRLLLDLVSVRVERVQEITEEDAKAEGIGSGFQMNSGWPDYTSIRHGVCGRTQDSVRMSYETLWASLNSGRGISWSANPWVWVLTFKRVSSPEVL